MVSPGLPLLVLIPKSPQAGRRGRGSPCTHRAQVDVGPLNTVPELGQKDVQLLELWERSPAAGTGLGSRHY